MSASRVVDIVRGGADSADTPIETVYAKVVPLYAVYQTAERVIVQYADDPKLGSDQRQALIALNPVKDEINGLIDGWRSSTPVRQARARKYDRDTAAALVIGLQGDAAGALARLTAIKVELLAERTSIARSQYLLASAGATLAAMLLFFLLYQSSPSLQFRAPLWFSAGIGAIGAFFSVAIAIRGRQIGTDLQWRDNLIDAILRIVIGVISAAVLYCLLAGDLVTFGFGGRPIDATMLGGSDVKAQAAMVVIAFVAGFSERLVGDMLSSAVLGVVARATGTVAVAGVGKAAGASVHADEKNPLGKPPSAPPPAVAAPPPDDGDDDGDQAEGCLDHAHLDEDELTHDVELPEAVGGVADAPATGAGEGEAAR